MPIIKKYNKDFFKKWSHDMAYVLGFLYADGNIVATKRGNYYIAFYTSDRELLVRIKKILKSEHKISCRTSETGKVYRIQVGSKEWFTDMARHGLHPGKARRMRLPTISPTYFGSFVRGYFDGDGNVWSGFVHKDRSIPSRVLYVAFTCASDAFLQDLQKRLLRRAIVSGGSIYTSKVKNFSRLNFSTKDALKIYRIMYTGRHKLFLKRKKVVFEQFMKMQRFE
jgi:hypothetical protein